MDNLEDRVRARIAVLDDAIRETDAEIRELTERYNMLVAARAELIALVRPPTDDDRIPRRRYPPQHIPHPIVGQSKGGVAGAIRDDEAAKLAPGPTPAPAPRAPRRDVRGAVFERLRDNGPGALDELHRSLVIPQRGIEKALAYWTRKGAIEQRGDRWAVKSLGEAATPLARAHEPDLEAIQATEANTPLETPPNRFSTHSVFGEDGPEASGEQLGVHLSTLRATLEQTGPQTLFELESRGVPPAAVHAALKQGLIVEGEWRGYTVYALAGSEAKAAE